jgi:hypothetical protein
MKLKSDAEDMEIANNGIYTEILVLIIMSCW